MCAYIYYALKTLLTLSRGYVKDLATLGGSAAGFVFFVISLLWTHPGKHQPDSDKDNLLEGQQLRKPEEIKFQTPDSKRLRFSKNMKKLRYFATSLVWTFYSDIFACIAEGFGFFYFNLSSFPQYVLLHLGSGSHMAIQPVLQGAVQILRCGSVSGEYQGYASPGKAGLEEDTGTMQHRDQRIREKRTVSLVENHKTNQSIFPYIHYLLITFVTLSGSFLKDLGAVVVSASNFVIFVIHLLWTQFSKILTASALETQQIRNDKINQTASTRKMFQEPNSMCQTLTIKHILKEKQNKHASMLETHKSISKPINQNMATGVFKPKLVHLKDDVEKRKTENVAEYSKYLKNLIKPISEVMASNIKDEYANVNENIGDLKKQINPWQYDLTNENEYDFEKICKSANIILPKLKTDNGNLFELNAAKSLSIYQKDDVDVRDDIIKESHEEDINDNDELNICIKTSVKKNTNEKKEEYDIDHLLKKINVPMADEDMNIQIPVTQKDEYPLVPGYLIEINPEKEGSNCKQEDGFVHGNMIPSQEEKINNNFKLGTCVEAQKEICELDKGPEKFIEPRPNKDKTKDKEEGNMDGKDDELKNIFKQDRYRPQNEYSKTLIEGKMIKYEVEEIERLIESKMRTEKNEYQHKQDSNNELENTNNTKADIDAMSETNIYNIDEHEITTSVTPDENAMEYQQKNLTTYSPRNLNVQESKTDNVKKLQHAYAILNNTVLNNTAKKYGNVNQKNPAIGSKFEFEVVNAAENLEPSRVQERSLIEQFPVREKSKDETMDDYDSDDKNFVELKNKNEPEEDKSTYEFDDLNVDELQILSEPNTEESMYRTSDIKDIETKTQLGNLEDAVCLSSTSLCKDLIHESRSSLLSESQNESLDKKSMFSVEDKAAYLSRNSKPWQLDLKDALPPSRAQSAAYVTKTTPSINAQAAHVRSASATPGQAPSSRPGSAMGSSSCSLHRALSYRLLGGRLMDSMIHRDTSWKDDAGRDLTDQAASMTISREPYLITTKEGKKQTLAEYEKSLVLDYRKRNQHKD